jgi:FKBP-type peptidyl-prolyl cis-trans isomerase
MPICWLLSATRISALVLFAATALPAAAADDTLSVAANAAYLAANARKPGTIVRPDGLQYRVIRNGTGPRPGSNDVVRIAYSVRLINGKVVDTTNPALPSTVSLTTMGIGGLAEALSLMHVGDHWQLALPSNIALGPKGAADGTIPPDQTLLFDLTLVSTAPPAPGQSVDENPFSVWSRGRESGASFTIHP